jgi:hypothetical protein
MMMWLIGVAFFMITYSLVLLDGDDVHGVGYLHALI